MSTGAASKPVGAGAVLLALASTACMFEQRAHQSDAALIANFVAHRAELEQIRQMAEADRSLNRVAMDFVWNDDRPGAPGRAGIATERWDEYKRLFTQADVPDGFLKPAGRGMLLLFSSSQGTVAGGTAKGYAYSKEDLGPIVDSLDDTDRPVAHTVDARAFVRLDGGWFLFFERS